MSVLRYKIPFNLKLSIDFVTKKKKFYFAACLEPKFICTSQLGYPLLKRQMACFIELAILVVLMLILVKIHDIAHHTRLILFQLSRPQQPSVPAAGIGARRRLRY